MSAKTIKLLFIEDDTIDQMAFKRFVSQENLPYDCTIISSIEEAEKCILKNHFDVIITDYNLDGGTAFDVIELMKEIPIIFITGQNNAEVAAKAMKAGAYDFLVKDIDRDYLKVIPITVENAIKHKSMEDRIRKLSRAVEQSPGILMITDIQGQIEYVNPKFSSVTGFSIEEIVGKNPRILRSEGYDSEMYKTLWQTISKGEDWQGEFRNRKKDGTLYWESASISPIQDANGNITHYLKVGEDITERKKVEKELHIAKEKAEIASRTKSEFLANMSHEIRTPMNGIIGMTELALDSELTPQQRKYLTTVKQSADSLLALLNDILDFSKIEARKLNLEEIDFNLHMMIDTTINTLMIQAYKKGLDLNYYMDSESAVYLKGDSGRLSQILINLIGNAIKFTEKGGVELRIREVKNKSDFSDCSIPSDLYFDSQANGEKACLHFSVKDNGIGIPPKKISTIFESFTQADSSHTRKYSGTGLGLTISKQLVEIMGGRIWAESEVGAGSTFHFTVCLPIGQAPETETLPYTSFDFKGIKTLIVDDNTHNIVLLKEILRSWGFETVEVRTGKDALLKMDIAANRNMPFALVCSDLQMPEMNGLELAEAIRKNPAFEKSKIILLASVDDKKALSQCKKWGIPFLEKPIRQHELLQAIMRTLDQTKLHDSSAPSAYQEKGESAYRILLAEDDPINQEVAVGVLKKRGHQITVADNGKAAIQLLEEQTFDLVLMDVQMPEMGGYETTKIIRDGENEKINSKIPIIAMTAHAMKGDRERCLETGMDDYVSKPINAKVLFKTIDKVMSQRGGTASTPSSKSSPVKKKNHEDQFLLNKEIALERLGGDESLLDKIWVKFQSCAPEQMTQLQSALDENKIEVVERIAHSLKSGAANIGAESLSQLANQTELAAKDNNMYQISSLTFQLNSELEKVIRQLSQTQRTPV